MKNAQVSDHVIILGALPDDWHRKGIVVAVTTGDDDEQTATVECAPGQTLDFPVSLLERDPIMNSYDEDA